MPDDERITLRFATYLAPSLPLSLFEFIVERARRQLDRPVSLTAEIIDSGPPLSGTDPFSTGAVDVAFVCAPSYLRLASESPPPIRLVAAAPLFDDPRARGRPVYFSDVIVGQTSHVRTFDDLRGSVWVYNDRASLSGWYCVLDQLSCRGLPLDFFRAFVASGSHLASIDAVARGAADAAAIDSNVLAYRLRADPDLAHRVRVLESWGPFPIQPVVAASRLPRSFLSDLAAALCTIEPLPSVGFRGFHPVDHAFYAAEQRRLSRASTDIPPRR